IQLLRLVKALARKTRADQFVDLYVITRDNYPWGGTGTNPYGGGVTGLAFAIAQGDHRFFVRNLDVSTEDLESPQQTRLIQMIVEEEPSDKGKVVKLRAGRRYRRAFVRLDWGAHVDSLGLESDGVYVIAGGSGSVGRVVTRHLIAKYRANV